MNRFMQTTTDPGTKGSLMIEKGAGVMAIAAFFGLCAFGIGRAAYGKGSKNGKIRTVEQKKDAEKKTIRTMIRIYCKGKHQTEGNVLCQDCEELISYAEKRIELCPNTGTGTFCGNCKKPCYAGDMRKKMREVMKYSGMKMLFLHPGMVVEHAVDAFTKN